MSTVADRRNSEDLEHEDRVRSRVVAALSEGKSQLMAVLPFCDGADPRLVAQLLGELTKRRCGRIGLS